jgi:hypothetical protein
MNRRKHLVLVAYMSLLVFAPCVKSQVAVNPAVRDRVNRAIDASKSNKSLACEVDPWGPTLGFNFIYTSGYILRVKLDQVTPGERLNAYIRVTPKGSSPLVLREFFNIPTLASGMPAPDSKALKNAYLTTSGAFNVGPGEYAAELLLVDRAGHGCYKHWNMKTGKYPENIGPSPLASETAAQLAGVSWDGKLDPNGVRLTVLLDAGPMNPYSSRLYAWDRAPLLQGLASMLKQIPCRSVSVIAFNLDQLREVFHDETFDSNGFSELAVSLRNLELGTVSYQALQRGAAADFLKGIANDQISAGPNSDAIVFLGPLIRSNQDPHLPPADFAGLHFFDFEFDPLGLQFPNTIQHLTRDLHGPVFHINTSKDLGEGIQKMLAALKADPAGADNSSHP